MLKDSQHDLVMRKAERACVTDSQRFIGVSGADLTGQPVQPQRDVSALKHRSLKPKA